MDDETRIAEELRRIVAALTELTGLPSRWIGQVTLVTDEDIQGSKSFRCGIYLKDSLADDPLRWRTLIHEALHSVSVGFVRDDYQRWRGWEEGVVEQSQRLYRPLVLSALNGSVDAAVFEQQETKHRFNIYIDAIEQLRRAFGESDALGAQREFYRALLAMPLRERSQFFVARGYDLPVSERASYMRNYSLNNYALTRRIF